MEFGRYTDKDGKIIPIEWQETYSTLRYHSGRYKKIKYYTCRDIIITVDYAELIELVKGSYRRFILDRIMPMLNVYEQEQIISAVEWCIGKSGLIDHLYWGVNLSTSTDYQEAYGSGSTYPMTTIDKQDIDFCVSKIDSNGTVLIVDKGSTIFHSVYDSSINSFEEFQALTDPKNKVIPVGATFGICPSIMVLSDEK